MQTDIGYVLYAIHFIRQCDFISDIRAVILVSLRLCPQSAQNIITKVMQHQPGICKNKNIPTTKKSDPRRF